MQQENPSTAASMSVITLPQCAADAEAEELADAVPDQVELEEDLTQFHQSSTDDIEVTEAQKDPGKDQYDREEDQESEEGAAEEVEEEQGEERETGVTFDEDTQRSGYYVCTVYVFKVL